MKKLIMFFILGILLCPPLAMANTVPVDAGVPADGTALVEKANNMANSLHSMAMQLSVPLVIIIVVVGVALGIFFDAARRMALFAVLALIVIYWAPMLVNLVVNWIQ